MPDKEGFWSFVRTPLGAVLLAVPLTAAVVFFGQGILRPGDLRGQEASAKVISDNEAMKLYIRETARATAEEVVKASDARWSERWTDLKDDVNELKRSARWSGLRSEAQPNPRPSTP